MDNGSFPLTPETARFGKAFDALGSPLPDDQAAAARFCTQVRLTNLYSAAGGNGRLAGNGLIRAEVRVFWLRDGATLSPTPALRATPPRPSVRARATTASTRSPRFASIPTAK